MPFRAFADLGALSSALDFQVGDRLSVYGSERHAHYQPLASAETTARIYMKGADHGVAICL